METLTGVDPYWAAITVWVVVNAVNLLQAAGFISRVVTGSQEINHIFGYVMIGLAIPAAVALVAFLRSGAGWLYWVGRQCMWCLSWSRSWLTMQFPSSSVPRAVPRSWCPTSCFSLAPFC